MIQRIWRICYAWIVFPVMKGAVYLLALKNRNLKTGLEDRKGVWPRLEAQLAERDSRKPLIWFHVSSAGEFLQAQPVFERCMKQGYESAVTFTSVNGYRWIQRTTFPEGQRPVVREYLPLDSVKNMRRLLKLLQPAVILYVKYDLWPNLIWEAYAAQIPQYLISATLQPKSMRLTLVVGRSLYRTLYACLNGIFTVTEDDRRRFLSTNPDHPNIQVVGDTRFDSVLDRREKLAPPQLPDAIRGKFIFIAGSTWPPDEACIFPALKEALQRDPNFLLIIAPHEPTAEHLRHSETFFKDFPVERLTKLRENPGYSQHYSTPSNDALHSPRVIVVDTIGVLSSLYSVGTLAYVGGAFDTGVHNVGVHNVMEPCAMGLSVSFGPNHYNSPEAIDLLKRGLAFTVNNTEEFRKLLFRLLSDPEQCKQLGEEAAKVIESQAGAADRCIHLITEKLTR